jgi:hypothetical protein
VLALIELLPLQQYQLSFSQEGIRDENDEDILIGVENSAISKYRFEYKVQGCNSCRASRNREDWNSRALSTRWSLMLPLSRIGFCRACEQKGDLQDCTTDGRRGQSFVGWQEMSDLSITSSDDVTITRDAGGDRQVQTASIAFCCVEIDKQKELVNFASRKALQRRNILSIGAIMILRHLRECRSRIALSVKINV